MMNAMPDADNRPRLVAQATAWVQAQQDHILRNGAPLDDFNLALAAKTGVREPEQIRILFVEQLPVPTEEPLRTYVLEAGLFGPEMIGMALGYGVYAVPARAAVRLYSHEFRHVAQYEAMGGIHAFIPEYMEQIFTHGYTDAPLEVDARAHEIGSP